MFNLAMFKICKSVGLFFLLLWIALLVRLSDFNYRKKKNTFTNNISIPHGNAALKSNVDVFARQLSALSEIVNHYCPKTQLQGSNNKNPAVQKYVSEIYSELNDLKVIKRCVNMTFLFRDDISTDLSRYNSFLTLLYNDMERKLSKNLALIADRYRFPKEDKEKLWKECKEGIEKEFKEVNDYYNSICKDYENTLIIPGFLFNIKLEKYIKLWKKVAYRNERKWIDTFERRISKYYKSKVKI
ncbi:RAD protein [Plasmodium cynomolgi strain B]|uniref:RAD protein n=1 Tax=Plasmodium cynomolgi (strain B) TaxID=1120755 RepID=K6UF87_PLACD|nr:RAD protein [Plasmodium cynomolgi strain B]GAB69671.1 RAD protein [Plasmodium cynomolgi strain B]